MACPTGKKRHGTKAEADAKLGSIWRIGRRSKMPVRSYKCPICGGWHLTKVSRWR